MASPRYVPINLNPQCGTFGFQNILKVLPVVSSHSEEIKTPRGISIQSSEHSCSCFTDWGETEASSGHKEGIFASYLC